MNDNKTYTQKLEDLYMAGVNYATATHKWDFALGFGAGIGFTIMVAGLVMMYMT